MGISFSINMNLKTEILVEMHIGLLSRVVIDEGDDMSGWFNL